MFRCLLMVALAAFIGFTYGRVWWPFAWSHAVPSPEYVGVLGLSVVGGLGLSGTRWIPSLFYGLCMFAGFGLSAIV